jgi:hypothetical protein
MSQIRRRLAEADAALDALETALPAAARSVIGRDSTILRLIYSYQAIWKACQRLLAERDDVEVGSPNDAIRAARRLGWLSDEDAEAAMVIGDDCALAVQVYRSQIGKEVSDRLPAHEAVLRRWLAALRQKALDIEKFLPSDTYQLFEQAMVERKQILCEYEGYPREICPIIFGHSRGEEKSLTYQFGGRGRSALPPGGQWKCLWLFKVSNPRLRSGSWYSGDSHVRSQTCVEVVDLDINPHSPYNPKRRLEPVAAPMEGAGRKRATSRRARKA